MQDRDKGGKSSGIGVLGLLGVAFVVLKLTGVIDWSWWWVTIPFWGLLAIVMGLWVLYALIVGTIALFKKE